MNASGASSAQLSSKMMKAQVYFQKVVKQELQVLVASGLDREVAVKMLLRRIVKSTYEPEESDVKHVMRQFQMIHDDAVRALIVKQEIGRLKGQGLDAFAAIELLTRKMQGISVPSDEQDEENVTSQSSNAEMADASPTEPSEVASEPTPAEADASASGNTEMQETATLEDVETAKSVSNDSVEQPTVEDVNVSEEKVVPNEAEEPQAASQDALSVSSLSLCERIDQVSISASPPTSAAVGGGPVPPASPSLATTHSTRRSAFTLFSTNSRKRRVDSGASSPLSEREDTPASPRSGASASTTRRPSFSMSRPMSPTFRFPKSKKQKIWTDDENNEPFFDPIAFKNASLPPPASPTAVSTSSETPTSSNTATPTKVGKRRRAVHGASSSPEIDEIDVEDHVIRVSKRHKL